MLSSQWMTRLYALIIIIYSFIPCCYLLDKFLSFFFVSIHPLVNLFYLIYPFNLLLVTIVTLSPLILSLVTHFMHFSSFPFILSLVTIDTFCHFSLIPHSFYHLFLLIHFVIFYPFYPTCYSLFAFYSICFYQFHIAWWWQLPSRSHHLVAKTKRCIKSWDERILIPTDPNKTIVITNSYSQPDLHIKHVKHKTKNRTKVFIYTTDRFWRFGTFGNRVWNGHKSVKCQASWCCLDNVVW